MGAHCESEKPNEKTLALVISSRSVTGRFRHVDSCPAGARVLVVVITVLSATAPDSSKAVTFTCPPRRTSQVIHAAAPLQIIGRVVMIAGVVASSDS